MKSHLRRLREQRSKHTIDASNLEYIYNLSNIYSINPYTLLQGFFRAEKENRVTFGTLTIKRRKKEANHTIFLITQEQNIIAQMRVKNDLWNNLDKTKTTYEKVVNPLHSFPII